jgi:riboflavin biosynthesis pyrimidine reductase
MRMLLPEPRADVDVHEHYAADWIERGGIRANMVASVDGAAAANGLTAGLQTPGDNLVFAALRDLADVVLVGYATAAAEGYRPVQMDADRLARRAAFDLPATLPIAVVTRSLAIDRSAALFATASTRPLVVTCAASDAGRRAELTSVAEILVCGQDDIDYAALRREFAERGLTRVVCEGGPTLLSRILAASELDELCLSMTPLVAGPGPMRIVDGAPWRAGTLPVQLHSLLEEDGALFLRYRRG